MIESFDAVVSKQSLEAVLDRVTTDSDDLSGDEHRLQTGDACNLHSDVNVAVKSMISIFFELNFEISFL